MGTLHAWESFGDGIAVRLFNIHSGLVCTYVDVVIQPDIQAVAKGLGGG
jgi:adenosylmethionine-8-amino-7-oxononanoate aminotransferase